MQSTKGMVNIGFLLIWLSLSADVAGIGYGSPIDKAEWRLERSPLVCRLYQRVPFFGSAEFEQQAGEVGGFRLKSTHAVAEGSAQIRIDSPPWRHQGSPGLLAAVPVFSSNEPLLLDTALSEQLLTWLYQGLIPVLAGLPRPEGAASLDVSLSSVNFQPAYQDYLDCIAGLIPARYADIERSRLSYAVNQWLINQEARDRLDLIIRYVKADERITGIFVDGYTDDQGRRKFNRDLSKRRAETVNRYLTSRGVPEDILTVRFHGESLPVRAGRDKESRAENRRVTIRMERS